MDQRLAWRAIAVGSGLAAGLAARAALNVAWKKIEHADPPANPASRRTSWPVALTWTISVAIAMGVARLVAQRGAAEAWRAATGSYPEGLDDTTA
jgi:hypothetical protein